MVEKIEEFFSAYPTREFGKGHILLHAHDNPTQVFHLLQGRVKQYDISYRGDEVVLNVFKPSAFFPMSFVVNDKPNIHFFEAEEDIVVQSAPNPDVLAFIKANPDVLLDLLSRVYKGTDGLLGRLAHMMAGSARSRILYEILIECRRFGTARGSGMAIALTESDIGAHAGLARETVSREIRKLKEEGMISVIKNEIWVNDVDRLSASVGQEL